MEKEETKEGATLGVYRELSIRRKGQRCRAEANNAGLQGRGDEEAFTLCSKIQRSIAGVGEEEDEVVEAVSEGGCLGSDLPCAEVQTCLFGDFSVVRSSPFPAMFGINER